ncbi:MAG: DegQ family serine endoprotease [Verrucomicrobia bacterium]|nr:DegQ family serine endoprotease [Verrucomicrobiota bacterium]
MASTKSIFCSINLLSSSLLMACAPCCTQSLSAAVDPPIEQVKVSVAKQVSMEFAAMAKAATPAVVSVRIQYPARRAELQPPQGWEGLPNDQLPDEFWKHFFGLPMPLPEKRVPIMGLGSGFIVSQDGYILTNNHVVHDADSISIFLNDGREFPAKVIGADPSTDIALVKIDADKLPYLELADSNKMEPGEYVMAIGNPLGLQASVTVGVVSAVGRDDLDLAPIESFIQTDAAINRGNSGGCLLNTDAKVIGMNTAIASDTGGSMGIGFAIPSNLLKPVMQQLRTTGHVVRGFLGVALQRIDAKLAQAFKLPRAEGALVAEVVKGGPADKAGLHSGDVILKINNLPVENAGSLRNFVAMHKPGETLLLTIHRHNKEMVLQVTIGTHPESEMAAADVQNKTGILVQDLTPDLAQQLGYEMDKGVLIKYVSPNSNAYEMGLKQGQLIMSVNQVPVQSSEEFYRAVQKSAPNKRLLLRIKAGQVVRYVTIELR